MSHRHEWVIGNDVQHAYVYCKKYYEVEPNCENMTIEEAQRRLNDYERLKNATEQLSAGQALGASHAVRAAGADFNVWEEQDEADQILIDALKAYAAALEGE